jgi:hypothetical protein
VRSPRTEEARQLMANCQKLIAEGHTTFFEWWIETSFLWSADRSTARKIRLEG